MRTIGVTQRVDVIPQYGERRNCLDQKWYEFLYSARFLGFPLPNNKELALEIVSSHKLSGIILTGGNNLKKYGGDSPERDETELALLEEALVNNIPLLGVCRGMQIIQDYFSISLFKIEGHVVSNQEIMLAGRRDIVNSYHDYGTRDNKSPLEVWGRSNDGIVKAVRHTSKPVTGIMWHPERFSPFREADIEMINGHFGRNGS